MLSLLEKLCALARASAHSQQANQINVSPLQGIIPSMSFSVKDSLKDKFRLALYSYCLYSFAGLVNECQCIPCKSQQFSIAEKTHLGLLPATALHIQKLRKERL